jgi:hypothetical protein
MFSKFRQELSNIEHGGICHEDYLSQLHLELERGLPLPAKKTQSKKRPRSSTNESGVTTMDRCPSPRLPHIVDITTLSPHKFEYAPKQLYKSLRRSQAPLPIYNNFMVRVHTADASPTWQNATQLLQEEVGRYPMSPSPLGATQTAQNQTRPQNTIWTSRPHEPSAIEELYKSLHLSSKPRRTSSPPGKSVTQPVSEDEDVRRYIQSPSPLRARQQAVQNQNRLSMNGKLRPGEPLGVEELYKSLHLSCKPVSRQDARKGMKTPEGRNKISSSPYMLHHAVGGVDPVGRLPPLAAQSSASEHTAIMRSQHVEFPEETVFVRSHNVEFTKIAQELQQELVERETKILSNQMRADKSVDRQRTAVMQQLERANMSVPLSFLFQRNLDQFCQVYCTVIFVIQK